MSDFLPLQNCNSSGHRVVKLRVLQFVCVHARVQIAPCLAGQGAPGTFCFLVSGLQAHTATLKRAEGVRIRAQVLVIHYILYPPKHLLSPSSSQVLMLKYNEGLILSCCSVLVSKLLNKMSYQNTSI